MINIKVVSEFSPGTFDCFHKDSPNKLFAIELGSACINSSSRLEGNILTWVRRSLRASNVDSGLAEEQLLIAFDPIDIINEVINYNKYHDGKVELKSKQMFNQMKSKLLEAIEVIDSIEYTRYPNPTLYSSYNSLHHHRIYQDY